MKPYRIIISGGGTGGHIFPAISIANTFKSRYPDAEILFVGADNRMEMERVPEAGYKIIGLPISGFNRSNKLKNISVLIQLYKSVSKAKKIIRDFKPDAVIGVGGYASGPILWTASSLHIPTLIQEQNSYAGITNKWLGKRVAKICVAYEGMDRFFPSQKIVVTGNPIRQDLEASMNKKNEALDYFQFKPEKKTVLILGGSLGARTINHGMIHGLDKLLNSGVQFIWQTGRYYLEGVEEQLKNKDTRGVLWYSDFISRMDYAYAAADLVVSRAGASSISELCLLGKSAILIPSPNVAEDHQTKNALAIVDKGAAVLLKDKDTEELLVQTILNLVKDSSQMGTLSLEIVKLAHPHSAERIVDEIEKIIKNNPWISTAYNPFILLEQEALE